MCYRNLPSHPIGEYQIDFMSLFSLRLRVFAVKELRFLGSFVFLLYRARIQVRSAILINRLGGRDAVAFEPLDRQVKVALNELYTSHPRRTIPDCHPQQSRTWRIAWIWWSVRRMILNFLRNCEILKKGRAR